MAELKTRKNEASVETFIESITDEQQRKDSYTLLDLMRKASKAEPRMWGGSIIGFGDYHYLYDSGREGDWFMIGFSPRKQALTLYLMGGLQMHEESLTRLGKHKIGKSCLYIKSLADIDQKILKAMIAKAVKTLNQKPG